MGSYLLTDIHLTISLFYTQQGWHASELLELSPELTIFETKNNVELYIHSEEMQWYFNVTTVGVQHISPL